jgi:anti-anti-sigma regulatory factor
MTMLKIERTVSDSVLLKIAGRLDPENVGELVSMLAGEPAGRTVVLDLKELTLVDRESVRLLLACEASGVVLRNCPPYIRVWIAREKEQP